jgi:hypothetical protein
MARLTQEQYIENVHTQVPKNYAEFCQKPLRWYIGAALVNTIWIVDPTGVGASLTLGSLLSLIIQSAYIIHFRSQVIVPFRLTYNLPRKLISSWTLGMTYAALLFVIQVFRVIPFFGSLLAPLGGALLIGVNTVVAYRYHQWQFSRQYANQSLHPVEWGVMACVTGGAMILVVLACILLYQVGLFVEDVLIGLKGCL